MSEDQSDLPPPPTQEAIKQGMAIPSFAPTGLSIAGARWVLSIGLTNTLILGQVAAEPVMAQVHLSWPLAKALSEMLQNAVAEYEQAEGDVHLPTSFVEQQGARAKTRATAAKKRKKSAH